MKISTPKYSDIDEYIEIFPMENQKILKKIRAAIKEAAPEAEETISYKMPAFKYHGILVYFAGYKNHYGFYPASSGIKEFQKELSEFKYSKGTIQFPVDKPIPFGLIKRIVKFRAMENLEKSKNKKKKR